MATLLHLPIVLRAKKPQKHYNTVQSQSYKICKPCMHNVLSTATNIITTGLSFYALYAVLGSQSSVVKRKASIIFPRVDTESIA